MEDGDFAIELERDWPLLRPAGGPRAVLNEARGGGTPSLLARGKKQPDLLFWEGNSYKTFLQSPLW